MQISKNFSLAEFARSQVASRLGIDNTPPLECVGNIQALTEEVLQPLREMVGLPIMITSGYRCAGLNKAVRGVKNSQHMRGEAVDIECPGMSNGELYQKIQEWGLPFDQLILEHHYPDEPRSGWVHLSYSSGDNRQQALIIGGAGND